MKTFSFIINPIAGKLSLNGKIALIKENCKSINYQIFICNSKEKLTERAETEIKNRKVVVACGGDGTVNLIASVVVKNKGQMAVLPLGRGNDFALNIGISSYRDAFKALSEGTFESVKYLSLQFENKEKKVGLTCAGVGMLSLAAFRASKIPFLKGKPLYLLSALISILKLESYQYSFTIDGSSSKMQAIVIVVAASKFTGGGLPIAPNANSKRNKLNILIAKNISKVQALRLIIKVTTGSHIFDRAVDDAFGETFRIDTDTASEYGKYVYADGEYLGKTPVKISLGKHPLNVLVSNHNFT